MHTPVVWLQTVVRGLCTVLCARLHSTPVPERITGTAGTVPDHHPSMTSRSSVRLTCRHDPTPDSIATDRNRGQLPAAPQVASRGHVVPAAPLLSVLGMGMKGEGGR